jgi:MFS family permease
MSYISVIPPDGGWGWVVSVGAAWCNGAIFGMINSYSKMLVPIHQQYPAADNYSISWINSLFFGLTFALSPVAGILSDRFGIRAVCATGSLIAALGMFASSYTTTIHQLMLTYGVILGKCASSSTSSSVP